MRLIKTIEMAGRQLLVRCVAWLAAVQERPVSLPEAPRILVVRLDARLGNQLMLTPLVASLRERYPNASIDVLADGGHRRVLTNHPAITQLLSFRKRALLASDGPLGVLTGLRRNKYDLAIDASNPTDPSATQALLVRLSGAKHTVGPIKGGFAKLFSAPAPIDTTTPHEIDLRLQLLKPLPGSAVIATMSIPAPKTLDEEPHLKKLLPTQPFIVINVGARLSDKRLSATDYAQLAESVCAANAMAVFTYGPQEELLARQAASSTTGSILAPPTSVAELATAFNAASAVITCDTGPMHLAVALGVPTCGIFVSTDPKRYGYSHGNHGRIDARDGFDQEALHYLRDWIGRVLGAKAAE